MNKVTVHQATFGIVEDQGHSLLESTIQASFIRHLSTDKMGTINDWEEWKPYFKGYLSNGYYCFSKTYRDSTQKRRGAVFTHLLLVKIDEVLQINSLAIIFSLFKDKSEQLEKLQPIQVETSSNEGTIMYEGEIKMLIHLLFDKNEFPIIWLGESDFEKLLFELWYFLPDNLKKNFSFRYSVSEQDIPDDKPVLVYSKDIDSIKWDKFQKVRKGDFFELKRAIEKSIYSKGKDNCAFFLQELGYVIEDVKGGNAVDVAFEFYIKLDQLTMKDLLILIRKVGYLSPDVENGIAIKEKIINVLVLKFLDLEIVQIKHLRTLPLKSFKNGFANVQSSIEKFITYYLLKSKPSKEISELLLECREELIKDETDWWIDSVISSISKIFLSENKYLGRVLWNLWIFDIEFISWIDEYIDDTIEYEQLLIDSLPSKINRTVLNEILVYAQKKCWFCLHAHLLLSAYSPSDALEKQLKVDIGEFISTSIKLIVDKIEEQVLIELVLNIREKRLLDYISKLPNIGNSIDVSISDWRSIWLSKIGHTGNVWDGIEEPQKLLFALLDNVYFIEEGQDLREGREKLIELIGKKNPLGLLEYERRWEVWNKMKPPIKLNFINATKEEWLERLSRGDVIGELEFFLEKTIINSEDFQILMRKIKKDETILSLFEKFKQLPNTLLTSYIKNWVVNSKKIYLNTISLRRLGEIIHKRNHTFGKKHLLKYIKRTNNLSNAIHPFYATLSFYEQLKISLAYDSSKPLNPNDWWTFVESTFIDLYPNYQKIKTLWTNLGGEESQLITSGTAEDIWNELIRGLKNKQYKSVSLNKLLKEMRKKYNKNESLKLIKSTKKQFQ